MEARTNLGRRYRSHQSQEQSRGSDPLYRHSMSLGVVMSSPAATPLEAWVSAATQEIGRTSGFSCATISQALLASTSRGSSNQRAAKTCAENSPPVRMCFLFLYACPGRRLGTALRAARYSDARIVGLAAWACSRTCWVHDRRRKKLVPSSSSSS